MRTKNPLKLDTFHDTLQSFIKKNKKKQKKSVPFTSRKCYWTLSKTLLNGRKINDDKSIANFKENSDIFNSFSAKQRSLIDNGSTLASL